MNELQNNIRILLMLGFIGLLLIHFFYCLINSAATRAEQEFLILSTVTHGSVRSGCQPKQCLEKSIALANE